MHFPFTGKLLLLEWWTEDEQKHVSAARTLLQLICVWKAVLASEEFGYDAKPTGFYVAELVSPPLRMREVYAQHRYEQERLDFQGWVGCILREFEEGSKDKELPPGVTPCPETDSEFHMCEECLGGYVFAGKTLEEFYEERHAAFLGHYRRDEKGVPSRAAEVRPGQPLFSVVSDPGHHAHGTHVVDHDDATLYGGDRLFFFTGSSDKIPSVIQELHQRHRESQNEKARKEEERSKQRRTKEKQLRFLEVEKLVKKLFP